MKYAILSYPVRTAQEILDVQEQMNRYAAEGWHVLSVVSRTASPDIIVTFERTASGAPIR